jgi:hypothetical protein
MRSERAAATAKAQRRRRPLLRRRPAQHAAVVFVRIHVRTTAQLTRLPTGPFSATGWSVGGRRGEGFRYVVDKHEGRAGVARQRRRRRRPQVAVFPNVKKDSCNSDKKNKSSSSSLSLPPYLSLSLSSRSSLFSFRVDKQQRLVLHYYDYSNPIRLPHTCFTAACIP